MICVLCTNDTALWSLGWEEPSPAHVTPLPREGALRQPLVSTCVVSEVLKYIPN